MAGHISTQSNFWVVQLTRTGRRLV